MDNAIPPNDSDEQHSSIKFHSSDALYFSLNPSCVSSFYSFRPTSSKLSSMVHTLCPALSLRLDDNFDSKSKEIKNPIPNSLRLKIISASNLSHLEPLGFVSNPKCLIYWMGELLHQSKGSREKKEDTSSSNNSTSSHVTTHQYRDEYCNAEWNETFDILVDVDDLLYADLRIEIVDLDLGVYSDFLGQITLNGDDILECINSPKV